MIAALPKKKTDFVNQKSLFKKALVSFMRAFSVVFPCYLDNV